jgi:LAO/AO transport system kinase
VIDELLKGDRRALAKAITLVESTRPGDRAAALALLAQARAHAGRALRIGISGPPGVGKSTLIEALGMHLVGRGHRVAVLAVDPSSGETGGSILGDKTRMERLSMEEAAFIRPSPAAGSLGGLAARTAEALLLCAAAGFDVILVETVGVGQSESDVAGCTDLFVLLQQPHAGDELQAIKRGIVERADFIVVNKADIDPAAARRAALQYVIGRRGHEAVHVVSSETGEGIAGLWAALESAPRRRPRADQQAGDPAERLAAAPAGPRPFRVLGLQQVAIGAEDKQKLRRLWVDLLGLEVTGHAMLARENVDEDILRIGAGALAVEVDLMQPIEPGAKPAVHQPPLNHIGLWVDDLPAAVRWLEQQGLRFAPGGIRKGAGGHDVCFIHPRASEAFPLSGEGVLVELVQAPPDVIAALGG